jgi:hypothetical protein
MAVRKIKSDFQEGLYMNVSSVSRLCFLNAVHKLMIIKRLCVRFSVYVCSVYRLQANRDIVYQQKCSVFVVPKMSAYG